LLRLLIRLVIWLGIIVITMVALTNLWVVLSTLNQIRNVAQLDRQQQPALILGTSYLTREGASNPFFTSRISTAIGLYQEDLVSEFILSGSATDYYNEPKAMASSLMASGIPNHMLISDTLGVRTLSSIIRCREVYQKDKVIIITQRFHAYRALFISNYYNLEAVAVPTTDVNANGKPGLVLREVFARTLAVIDLYFLHRRP